MQAGSTVIMYRRNPKTRVATIFHQFVDILSRTNHEKADALVTNNIIEITLSHGKIDVFIILQMILNWTTT